MWLVTRTKRDMQGLLSRAVEKGSVHFKYISFGCKEDKSQQNMVEAETGAEDWPEFSLL
jgi:hypothetical protein